MFKKLRVYLEGSTQQDKLAPQALVISANDFQAPTQQEYTVKYTKLAMEHFKYLTMYTQFCRGAEDRYWLKVGVKNLIEHQQRTISNLVFIRKHCLENLVTSVEETLFEATELLVGKRFPKNLH